MATVLLQNICRSFLRSPISAEVLVHTRNKTRRQLPTKRKKNPYVKRFTDFIKHACITLVKYERLQTTLPTAYSLQLYGDTLIAFTRRRRPPPDLVTIKNGFFLYSHEIKDRLTRRVYRNRMVRYRVQEPRELKEEEYVAKCKEEAGNMLLHDQAALEKLYGELAERYKDVEGHYVKVTPIPHDKRCTNPQLAYVELINNGKPPLPKIPEMEKGRLKTFPRDTGHHFINTH